MAVLPAMNTSAIPIGPATDNLKSTISNFWFLVTDYWLLYGRSLVQSLVRPVAQ
jgi:hypothetical protein